MWAALILILYKSHLHVYNWIGKIVDQIYTEFKEEQYVSGNI